jgi:uncharacterized coiled-coil protein SlyX
MNAKDVASDVIAPVSTASTVTLGKSLASLEANVTSLGDNIERTKVSQISLTAQLHVSERPVGSGDQAALNSVSISDCAAFREISELNHQVQRDILEHKDSIAQQRQQLQELTDALARAEQRYGTKLAAASTIRSSSPDTK